MEITTPRKSEDLQGERGSPPPELPTIRRIDVSTRKVHDSVVTKMKSPVTSYLIPPCRLEQHLPI